MKKKLGYLGQHIFSKLSYPLHLNIISFFVSLFGSLRNKILFDSFRIPHYAFGIYEAASRAKKNNQPGITVIEFGVANGRGLMAMVLYAKKVSEALGIQVNVVGFDSGVGMPDVVDYRDHPEMYVKGDYPMIYRDKLINSLPANAKLVLRDLINETWTDADFKYPIGFISIDVDYYSSTISVLNRLLELDSELLLPNTIMYFDDVAEANHNPYQGELLAIREFNHISEERKIVAYSQNLRHHRVYKNAQWLDHMYQLHVLDNQHRKDPYRTQEAPAAVLANKYFE